MLTAINRERWKFAYTVDTGRTIPYRLPLAVFVHSLGRAFEPLVQRKTRHLSRVFLWSRTVDDVRTAALTFNEVTG